MIISSLPIHHTIKHLQPIFTIAKSSKYFATGGMNGEMKLWSLEYDLIKTVKKHAGSLTSIKFSKDEKYIASSGDDGKVFIFDSNAEDVLKTVKHPCDVTHVEWTPDFLISVNMDGEMVLTKIGNQEFTEFRKINNHSECILGLATSHDFKFVCTYSESKIVLYEDYNVKASAKLNKGVIMENLNSKISFSPNNKFISVGLQFNKKYPSVDIFDLSLNPVYSLIGHVAPSEITAFCSKIFKKIQKYCILAVASQDLSLSIWNTLNPRPFILIKNFTESPILDMFWDDLTLYVSSYDGIVKKLEFEETELGEIIAECDEDENFELPYTEKNIELQRNYEKRIEKLDFDEKLCIVKLGTLTVDGMTLQEALNKSRNILDSKKDQNTALSAIGENKINIQNKVDAIKPKRIAPVMVNPQKSAPVRIEKEKSTLVLFDVNLPEKLKIVKSTPFKSVLGDFTIELNEDIRISRLKRLFYKIHGPVNKVCFNNQFLVIFSTHIQVYYLETGCLVLPYINFKILFMDILNHLLLLVDCYGDFVVLDLKKFKSVQGKLPKTKNLSKIQLSKKYYIVAEYANPEELIFYNKGMKLWMSINPNFNSITSEGIDFFNDNDDTLAELEVSFAHFKLIDDYKNMKIVAKKYISLICRMKKLDEHMEYRIEYILNEMDEDFLELLLEEMNRHSFLQKFAVKMYKRFELN